MEDVETHTEVAEEQLPETGDSQVNEGVEQTEADTEIEAADTDTTEEQTAETEEPKPFQNGKEVLKINGQEIEADWGTVKKYAQIGAAGLQAMQKAKQIEKSATETYRELVRHAHKNPEAVIEILTGKKWSRSDAAQSKDGATNTEAQGHYDPRDERIAQLEAKIEQREIVQEQQAFQQEFNEAITKYPNLDDEIVQEYLKSQYKAALKNGLDVTVEDVAFVVSQKIAQKKSMQAKQRQKVIEQKKKTAPVSVRSATPKSKSDDSYDIEDVLKLAGRA